MALGECRIVFNHLPRLTKEMQAKASLAVNKAVHDIEGKAKSKALVDTGNLRGSIAGSMTGPIEGEVVVGAEYGIYQEFGPTNTRKWKFRPYMRPAADEVEPEFIAAMTKIVGI